MSEPAFNSCPAVALTLPAVALDLAAALAVGEGIHAGTVPHEMEVPVMGRIAATLDLTITGGTFTLAPSSRPSVILAVRGAVRIGLDAEAPIPSPADPIDVVVTAEVPIAVTLNPTSVTISLDVAGAEYRSAEVVASDGGELGPVAQIAGMLLMSMGEDLFTSLAGSMGSLEESIDGVPTADLGLATGPAEVLVGDGELYVGISPAVPSDQCAQPVVLGQRDQLHLGLAVAGSAVGPVLEWYLGRALGGSPVPFEIETRMGSAGLSGRVRNQRILPGGFPDVRPRMRSTIGVSLGDSTVDVTLTEAWVESPLLPRPVNRLNRQLGGLASSLVPKRLTSVSVPSELRFPLPEAIGGGAELSVTIAQLDFAHQHATVVVTIDPGL